MKVAISGALISALAIPSAVCAQTGAAPVVPTATPVPAAIAPIVAGSQDASILRAGTQVALKTSEPLTTKGKDLRVGYRFQLETAEPVMLNGQVVIPIGSPATGEVTDVRNKGMWGKSGRIGARVLFVRANGRQIRLTGQLDDKGTTGTGAVVASAVLLPLVGFFTTGTSAQIPLGAPVNAFIDEDVPVAFATGTVAPMSVPMSVAAPVAAPSVLPVAAKKD